MQISEFWNEEDPTKSIIAIYDYSWRSDEGLITEYDEEVEEVSRGTTPATGNTTENDEDHNKKGEEKPLKSTVGDNHNNSDSDLHMDDAQ
ncbi:unnamed protein product [Rhizophagus irregularis]|nr:unnamed protein product [Rhizophagus irregularis]